MCMHINLLQLCLAHVLPLMGAHSAVLIRGDLGRALATKARLL